MYIHDYDLQINPGLRELLHKHNQEIVKYKARVDKGVIVVDSEIYYVSDPKLKTYIRVKYKL